MRHAQSLGRNGRLGDWVKIRNRASGRNLAANQLVRFDPIQTASKRAYHDTGFMRRCGSEYR
jgi:hypothetical protein